jgi:S-adenosyl methyltransferase
MAGRDWIPGMLIRPGADVRANRAFLVRAVRFLAQERSVRQFLDIGTGLPTAGNTHEVAQAVVPAARIVYVDNDPVALMLLIVLHLIPDADDPYGIVAALLEALPSGSFLVLSHLASDIRAAQMAEMTSRVNERMSGPKATMRDRAAVTRFFDGLELLEPGVVQPQQWRPEPTVPSQDQVTVWCGVARKR